MYLSNCDGYVDRTTGLAQLSLFHRCHAKRGMLKIQFSGDHLKSLTAAFSISINFSVVSDTLRSERKI